MKQGASTLHSPLGTHLELPHLHVSPQWCGPAQLWSTGRFPTRELRNLSWVTQGSIFQHVLTERALLTASRSTEPGGRADLALAALSAAPLAPVAPIRTSTLLLLQGDSLVSQLLDTGGDPSAVRADTVRLH